MIAVFKREFLSYYRGLIGWIVALILLAAEGILLLTGNLLGGNSSFGNTLSMLALVLILVVPILCMRSVTEDKRSGTAKLLDALPLSTWEVVLGKFLAMFAVFAIPVLLCGLYPLLLLFFGRIYLATSYLCLLVFLLLGMAIIAFCYFLSSLVPNQIVSVILGIAGCAALYFITILGVAIPDTTLAAYLVLLGFTLVLTGILIPVTGSVVLPLITALTGILGSSLLYFVFPETLDGLVPRLFSYLSPFAWFDSFWFDYIFDVRGIVYLLSFTAFFLFLATIPAGKRRRA